MEASKAEYAKQEKTQPNRPAEARPIKEEVEAKIAQADALMNSLDAEARALLEEEQRAAAEAAAAQKQAEMEAEAATGRRPNSGNAGGAETGVPAAATRRAAEAATAWTSRRRVPWSITP